MKKPEFSSKKSYQQLQERCNVLESYVRKLRLALKDAQGRVPTDIPGYEFVLDETDIGGKMRVKAEYYGLVCEADVVVGDWIGDPSVTNGIKKLDPYIDEVYVHVPGEDTDLYEILSDKAIDEIIDLLLESE